ncbi:MAG: EAL domain-containing protein [Rhodocyclaceae bacterium]
MDARADERQALLGRLRRAQERGELLLHYQPQVETGSGRLVGVEALLRWQSPELGMVGPARFIPLAEEAGLIESIGEWVLQTACRQGVAWQQQGLPPMLIAVNLSARQFRQKNLALLVRQALRESGLEARWLELEVTEGMLMHDPEQAASILRELSGMGVHIAVDDFGTGYSSLSYLKRFPVTRLKVDQSFVRDIPGDQDDAAIVTAVVSLAHSLRMGVIAEGVETEAQRAFLLGLNCELCQGYLFSRPLPAGEIPAFQARPEMLFAAQQSAP